MTVWSCVKYCSWLCFRLNHMHACSYLGYELYSLHFSVWNYLKPSMNLLRSLRWSRTRLWLFYNRFCLVDLFCCMCCTTGWIWQATGLVEPSIFRIALYIKQLSWFHCWIHIESYFSTCLEAALTSISVAVTLRSCHVITFGLWWQQSRSWFFVGAKQDSEFGTHAVCHSCLSGCSLPAGWKTWGFLWRSWCSQGRLSYWYRDNEALCRYQREADQQQSIRSCMSQKNAKSWTDSTLALWREMRYTGQAMW